MREDRHRSEIKTPTLPENLWLVHFSKRRKMEENRMGGEQREGGGGSQLDQTSK